ncbi:4'-phosphopantetheinyl transferase superfamily protein [Paenibacillus polysaccharolyticus]|nr:4'-phosphopantetheinyl transferase superfamily protein [Paenibacillus polysaccharolyticus]
MKNSIKIFAVKIDQIIESQQFDQLIKFLDKSERTKIQGIKEARDAQRSLFSRLLIRIALIQLYGKTNEELVFKTNQYGKIYLKNFENVYFNTSHSDDWIVCCLDTNEIGIDIERIRPINVNIAKRFFSHDEYKYIERTTGDEQIVSFFRIWTAKESYVKAKGMGLSLALNSFSIDVHDQISKTYLLKDENWECCQLNFDEDYAMTICFSNVSTITKRLGIYYLSLDMILDLISKKLNINEVAISQVHKVSSWGILKSPDSDS